MTMSGNQPPEPPPFGAPQQPPYGQQSPPYGYPPPVPQQGRRLPADQERTWASAAHWSALVASVVALAFLGPLIVMLTKGNESVWVRRQAVESLNFQLSVLIYGVVSLVLCLVFIGFLLLVALGIGWLVLTIVGAVRAANGDDFRYPLTIRMVS
jgi:uncharacterized Tic20 family protein